MKKALLFLSIIGVQYFEGILGEPNLRRPGLTAAALKRGDKLLRGADMRTPLPAFSNSDTTGLY